jgi:hypothetical protein
MADYIYMTNPAKLKAFLAKIQGVGVPPKLTIKHLKSMGFTSSNDTPIVSAMKNLGFTDSSGVPTQRWQLYRNKDQAPTILAAAIREHYANLYQLYSDAHQKDTEALRNFFSTHTNLSEGTVGLIVLTFKTVASIADFNSDVATFPAPGAVSLPSSGSGTRSGSGTIKSPLAININIQLTLPEGSTPETFDAFFAAMKKYLLNQ